MPFATRVGLTFWTTALLSFPLIALLGEDGEAFEIVPIVAIAVAFAASLSRIPTQVMANILGIGGLATLFVVVLFLLLMIPYQPEKLNHFLLVVVVFGIMLGICLKDKRFLANTPIALLFIGSVGIALIAVNPSVYQVGRSTFEEANPIWMARTISLAGLSAVWFIVRDQKRTMAWTLLLISIGAIAMTGSRGPLVGLVAALGFGIVFLRRKGRLSVAAVILYGLAVLVVLQLSYGIIPELRSFSLEADSGRGEIYSYAIDLFREVPSGIGVGNFRFRTFTYPHNIFLEFLVEWGWFLGGVMIAFILWGGARLLRLPPEFDILKLAYAAELLNSMLSGDITSPRLLYALVVVGLLPLGYDRQANSDGAPSTG